MRKIIFRDNLGTEIYFREIDTENIPIFAKKDGKLCGMIINELENRGILWHGWILKTGGQFGAYGHHETLKDCIEKGIKLGYTFFVE